MRRRTSSAFPDASHSNFWIKLTPSVARLFGAFSTLRTKTINAGQIADFVDWQLRVFGARPTVFGRRETLWERLAQRLDPNRPLVVLEFGRRLRLCDQLVAVSIGRARRGLARVRPFHRAATRLARIRAGHVRCRW
jgi:hypothetical protein